MPGRLDEYRDPEKQTVEGAYGRHTWFDVSVDVSIRTQLEINSAHDIFYPLLTLTLFYLRYIPRLFSRWRDTGRRGRSWGHNHDCLRGV